MKLRFLGTGTSTGVPQLGCDCETCKSQDKRDKRLRTSALITTSSGANILIDCGPDFYHQMLAAETRHLDALLVTHIHYDHVGGIDDLRPFCGEKPFPIYCKKDVKRLLKKRLPYCFARHPYPGVPKLDVNVIKPFKEFTLSDAEILPVPVLHYKLEILGFRIGNLGYITDCKTMPEKTIEELCGIDTLVLNALRHKEHLSHLNLSQALELIERIKPGRAFLTHLSHQMGRRVEIEQKLPKNVHTAYDGLEIEIPD